MKSLWNDHEAAECQNDPLRLRVYTSRLIGREPSLVLHGGGNTSVKAEVRNFFGEKEKLLYVKGSGWDLATIEAEGFSPVRMETLLKLAQMETLSDTDMVREQKAAMLNPTAPAPSVEAILHALIPFHFVDHTHADAVVTLTNSPKGEEIMRELYGPRVLVMPYVMPGFILARQVFEATRDLNWDQYDGLVLMHHGIFSFANDARKAYERMIELVSKAEAYIEKHAKPAPVGKTQPVPHLELATLRKKISQAMGAAVVGVCENSDVACQFAARSDIAAIAGRGPLTPDHVIHTKRVPLVLTSDNVGESVKNYAAEYKQYFSRHSLRDLTCLDPAPRWVIWQGHGVWAFAPERKRAQIIADISRHTAKSIQWAEGLGGWQALGEKDIFDVEYWELEQAKLKKGAQAAKALQGKIALVTGAASGIGLACATELQAQGAAVVGLDIAPEITDKMKKLGGLGLVCDMTDTAAIDKAVKQVIETFAGLDIVVSNAGSFPAGQSIATLDPEVWRKTIDMNLSSHLYLLRACVPFLEQGVDAAVIIMGSKNVPAPGPGAAAYSSAKAGLTQLARVAALELAPKGIRVNTLHPNAVFDTGIWTPEILANRAKHYNMSVEQYKTNNLLHVEVTSKDVARLAAAMAGSVFAKTTGAQIAIDGGNDRVI